MFQLDAPLHLRAYLAQLDSKSFFIGAMSNADVS